MIACSFGVMDAWGAFYKATGKTATVVSGASRLLTSGSLQPPLAENWGTAEANRLSASVSCASGMRGSPASGSAFEGVSGSMQYSVLMSWASNNRWPYHKLILLFALTLQIQSGKCCALFFSIIT